MRALLATVSVLALMGMVSTAKADAINNLTIDVLTTPVPQSQSAPCIICGTTAQNPPNFGYNDFSATGNLSSYNTFSTNIINGGALPGNLEANALPYSGTLLEAFLNAGGTDPLFTFGVVIDINTAPGQAQRETLTSFQLIDLSLAPGSRIIYDFTGSLELPDTNNGNGFGDYLISGFCLSCAGVQPGDNLIFHASWEGATDGPESFYLTIIPSAVDVPEPGSLAMLGSMIGMLGGGLWWRRRKEGAA